MFGISESAEGVLHECMRGSPIASYIYVIHLFLSYISITEKHIFHVAYRYAGTLHTTPLCERIKRFLKITSVSFSLSTFLVLLFLFSIKKGEI